MQTIRIKDKTHDMLSKIAERRVLGVAGNAATIAAAFYIKYMRSSQKKRLKPKYSLLPIFVHRQKMTRLKLAKTSYVSETAVIARTAYIEHAARIGHNAKIGENVEIGTRVCIGTDCVIGFGAEIGKGSKIGEGSKIGAYTILHPCTHIGKKCVLPEDFHYCEAFELPDNFVIERFTEALFPDDLGEWVIFFSTNNGDIFAIVDGMPIKKNDFCIAIKSLFNNSEL